MRLLEEKIGYSFKDKELLMTALTHSSYANEKRDGSISYERLEFLGDSILSIVTAEFLYRQEPALPEGRMTKLRAELVCESSLKTIAQELGVGEHMRLGRGEERSGGRARASILADMVESVIAAIYLDSGMDEARSFIYRQLLDNARIDGQHRSAAYKTELQEIVQRSADSHISYEQTGESGPDHNKQFSFCVRINGRIAGHGSGHSKKEAEQAAARSALEKLGQ